MKRLTYLVIVFVLASCQPKETTKINQSGSNISLQDGAIIINNLYYQHLGDGNVLAVNKIENISDPTIIPEFIISPVLPKKDSAKWQIDFNAQQYDIAKNYLTTESYLEGKDYTFELYNINNGKKIINYTYDKFEVNYTNENERRIVAFYSKNAVNKENSGLEFNNKTLGYFLYAHQNGVISQLRLDAKDESLVDKYDVSNTNILLSADDETGLLRFNSNKSIFFTNISGENKTEINFNVGVTLFINDPYEPFELQLKVENDVLKFNEADLKTTDFVLVSN